MDNSVEKRSNNKGSQRGMENKQLRVLVEDKEKELSRFIALLDEREVETLKLRESKADLFALVEEMSSKCQLKDEEILNLRSELSSTQKALDDGRKFGSLFFKSELCSEETYVTRSRETLQLQRIEGKVSQSVKPETKHAELSCAKEREFTTLENYTVEEKCEDEEIMREKSFCLLQLEREIARAEKSYEKIKLRSRELTLQEETKAQKRTVCIQREGSLRNEGNFECRSCCALEQERRNLINEVEELKSTQIHQQSVLDRALKICASFHSQHDTLKLHIRKLNCKLKKLQRLLLASMVEKETAIKEAVLLKAKSENQVEAVKKELSTKGSLALEFGKMSSTNKMLKKELAQLRTEHSEVLKKIDQSTQQHMGLKHLMNDILSYAEKKEEELKKVKEELELTTNENLNITSELIKANSRNVILELEMENTLERNAMQGNARCHSSGEKVSSRWQERVVRVGGTYNFKNTGLCGCIQPIKELEFELEMEKMNTRKAAEKSLSDLNKRKDLEAKLEHCLDDKQSKLREFELAIEEANTKLQEQRQASLQQHQEIEFKDTRITTLEEKLAATQQKYENEEQELELMTGRLKELSERCDFLKEENNSLNDKLEANQCSRFEALAESESPGNDSTLRDEDIQMEVSANEAHQDSFETLVEEDDLDGDEVLNDKKEMENIVIEIQQSSHEIMVGRAASDSPLEIEIKQGEKNISGGSVSCPLTSATGQDMVLCKELEKSLKFPTNVKMEDDEQSSTEKYSSQMNSIGDDVPYQFSDENLAQTSPCDNEGDVEKTASNGSGCEHHSSDYSTEEFQKTSMENGTQDFTLQSGLPTEFLNSLPGEKSFPDNLVVHDDSSASSEFLTGSSLADDPVVPSTASSDVTAVDRHHANGGKGLNKSPNAFTFSIANGSIHAPVQDDSMESFNASSGYGHSRHDSIDKDILMKTSKSSSADKSLSSDPTTPVSPMDNSILSGPTLPDNLTENISPFPNGTLKDVAIVQEFKTEKRSSLVNTIPPHESSTAEESKIECDRRNTDLFEFRERLLLLLLLFFIFLCVMMSPLSNESLLHDSLEPYLQYTGTNSVC